MEEDARGPATLHTAVILGEYDKIRHLVRTGSSVNAYDERGYIPLQYAVVEGNFEIIILLAELGVNIDAGSRKSNDAPAHYAAMFGRVGGLHILLRYDVSLTVKNNSEDGEMPIHTAAKYNQNKHYFGCWKMGCL
jgi:ankyrin repeat protein